MSFKAPESLVVVMKPGQSASAEQNEDEQTNPTDETQHVIQVQQTRQQLSQHQDIVQLPEYLSEQLIPKASSASNTFKYAGNLFVWRRTLEGLILVNRLGIRLFLSIFCLIPGSVGVAWAAFLALLSLLLGIVPVSIHLFNNGWRQRKQKVRDLCSKQEASLSSSLYIHNVPSASTDEESGEGSKKKTIAEGEAPAEHHEEQDDDEEDEDVLEKQIRPQLLPSSIFSFWKVFLTTEPWGFYSPILFEYVSWLIFLISVLLRVLNEVATPLGWFSSSRLAWLIFGSLPLATGILHNLAAFIIPIYDISKTLDLNDRVIVHNEYGMILNNVCVEQFENSTGRMSEWEACGHRRPALLFDSIKEIALAVSLETVEQRAINMPWIYISCIKPNGVEHRVAMPIRLPETNYRIWEHLTATPLNDGLGVDETTDLLLKCVTLRRKDLSHNVTSVVKTLKKIKVYGFILE